MRLFIEASKFDQAKRSTMMTLALTAGSLVTAAGTALASASSLVKGGADAACQSACNTSTTVSGIFSNLVNVLIFLIGAISVVMIVIGGLRYVLSNGDSKSAESARNTILYAVIGVIISVAAYAIVRFVVGNIK